MSNFYSIEQKVLKGEVLSSEDEEFIVGKVYHYWENHPDVIYRYSSWKKILAWVAGYQWFDYNRVKKQLQPVPYIKRRIVINRLKPILRQMLGKIRTTSPQLGVIPNTNEYEDIASAKLGDKVLESLLVNLRFNKIRKDFFTWLLLVGKSCLRVFWDETKTGFAIGKKEINTKQQKQEVIEIEGDVGMEVVSPFNFLHDPLHSNPDKWRWFLFGELVDKQELANAYGIKVSELETESEEKRPELISGANFPSLEGEDSIPLIPVYSQVEEDVCRRFELWTKNMCIVIGGKKILEVVPNENHIIPFFVYEDQIIPMEFYEKGIVLNHSIFKDLIAPQKEYNRFISNLSSAIERASKIKIVSPPSGMINKSKVTDDGSVVIIESNPALGDVKQMKLDAIPPLAMPFKQDLERELENISGIHEVSFGRLPERASHASGTLVNLLLEQDDSLIDPLIKEVDEGVFAPACSYLLMLVQKHYQERRILKLVGRDKEEMVFHFLGADLKNNTDVFVSTNVSLPKSRALRTEWIIRIAQLGLIKDPKSILELLEFSEAKKLYEDELIHEKRALKENYDIETKTIFDIDSAINSIYLLDDDITHLKIHLRDRLSTKYENYDDIQKQVLDIHIQEHLKRLQASQQAQQAMLGQQKSIPEETSASPSLEEQVATEVEGNTKEF